MKLTIKIEGDDWADLTLALEEINRKVEAAYHWGHDANETGNYHFEVDLTPMPLSKRHRLIDLLTGIKADDPPVHDLVAEYADRVRKELAGMSDEDLLKEAEDYEWLSTELEKFVKKEAP